jgi:subtilisin family serine protease
MVKAILWLGVFFCLTGSAAAQNKRYLVRFADKAGTLYSLNNPAQFLSQRSIERRLQYNIPYDSTDLPIAPAYIDSLKAIASITVLNSSKWLNQVSVLSADSAALAAINRLPFVQSVTLIAHRTRLSKKAPNDLFYNQSSGMQAVSGTAGQQYNYGNSADQVNIHNGAFLHNIGLQGQGKVLTLLDAGFYQYSHLKAFDSVNSAGQVLGTWDFVAREESVTEDHPHGMQCFSVIAANLPGIFVGTAPKASFYLYRTEDAASEYPVEEHNWVCAAERADSAGSDVISSSLGYALFDDAALSYRYEDMNGNTTIAARGADLAARKGLLVVNAAGNEGSKPWKYIITPADGDSVLAVGAVNAKGAPAHFSSYGPSGNGRVKPDVASMGVFTTVQATDNTITAANGTSFACPNMAGLATCLWQGFPEYNNIRIIDALRKAGNQFNAPDDRVGYGIPDVKKAVVHLLQEFATVSLSDCKTLTWSSKDAAGMRYEIERMKAGENSFTKVGEQSGIGAVFQAHSYQFTDPELTTADGPVRYRIRQVIDTAAATFTAFYMDTVLVQMALSCNPIPDVEGNIQIIPNPVNNTFTLKIAGEAITKLQISIFNTLGQQVHNELRSKATGITLIPVGAAALAPGTYFVVVYDAQKKLAVKRFVKL